eukprot:14984175-Ditylum_brightwellii.AAC.1
MEVNTETTSFNLSIKEVEVEDITKAEVDKEVTEGKENFRLTRTPTSIAGPMEAAITLAISVNSRRMGTRIMPLSASRWEFHIKQTPRPKPTQVQQGIISQIKMHTI